MFYWGSCILEARLNMFYWGSCFLEARLNMFTGAVVF